MVDPTWLLILLIPVTGLVRGLNIKMAGEYRSQEACLAVSEQVKAIYLDLRDSELITLCVPDILETEE